MPTPRMQADPPCASRVPATYIAVYSLVTVLALCLIGHGAYTAIDNWPGTHHVLVQHEIYHGTDPLLIKNERMLATADEKTRKSDYKQGFWELTVGIPLLGWAGKMAVTCILFNWQTPKTDNS